MSFIKEALSPVGNVSCMRLMAMISLGAGIIIAIVGLSLGKDVVALVTVFITAAFGGKALQSFSEPSDPKEENPSGK